jgi:phosphate transport system substrate-binding protein
MNSMADAFISYRRRPSASLAQLLQEKLKNQHGIDAYVDTTRADSTHVQFPERLMQAIADSPTFVCLLGEGTLDSEWVRKEIQRAYDLKKFCVPVFQESYTPLAQSDDAVDYLLNFDGVHVFDIKNVFVDEAVRQLAERLPRRRSSRRGLRTLILAGAAVFIIAVAAMLALSQLNGGQSGASTEDAGEVAALPSATSEAAAETTDGAALAEQISQAEVTSAPEATNTLVPDIATLVLTVDAQATIDMATQNARGLTETATAWTATPTPDVTASIEAFRAQRDATATQAWMDTWTDTPAGASEPQVALPVINPAAYEGEILAGGSTVVGPAAELVRAAFEADGFEGLIEQYAIGTSAGFERFCVEGATDIAFATRRIREQEISACEALGRTPIELRIGSDALVVVTSLENDFVPSGGLTLEQLTLALTTAVTWADVNPAWPDEPIVRYLPSMDSAAFDFLVTGILFYDEGDLLSASNVQFTEDDRLLVNETASSPYAIGVVSHPFYVENADDVRAIAVEGVLPEDDTFSDMTYPLVRPMYLYTAASILQEKPQALAYLVYFVIHMEEAIQQTGYVPLPEDDFNQLAEQIQSLWDQYGR